MTEHIAEIIICLFLITIVTWAISRIMRKAKRGGGCCGEHEADLQTISVKDKDKSHYPYAIRLKIGGMTCTNCARRVENALNAENGIWATVDKNSDTARILLK
ncbi:MAG: cation transporter, partial [Lachnospiraceae bacterium]|nr:cation transporter [Lachnospiraceae bacterium]